MDGAASKRKTLLPLSIRA